MLQSKPAKVQNIPHLKPCNSYVWSISIGQSICPYSQVFIFEKFSFKNLFTTENYRKMKGLAHVFYYRTIHSVIKIIETTNCLLLLLLLV